MENYKINPVSKTLIVSAAFEKAMNNPDSAEYQLYIKLQHDIPGLKVSRRSHKSPVKYHSKKSGEVFYCNQYKNLTYKNMERFIRPGRKFCVKRGQQQSREREQIKG